MLQPSMSFGPSDMYELLSADQMNAADAQTIASGVPGQALMQAAGEAVANAATRLLDERQGPGNSSVVIIAGPGNNGGDGAIAALKLQDLAGNLTLVRFRHDLCSQADALTAFQRCNNAGIVTMDIDTSHTSLPDECSAVMRKADLTIDALFGAGLSRPVTGIAAELVSAMNQNAAPVLSVDLPSGMDGNSDQALGNVIVSASHTVTFFRFKPAHFLLPGKAQSGRLELAQIGIEDDVLQRINPATFLNDPTLWKSSLRQPELFSHKFLRGSVLVRGGGRLSTGASRLSAQAALQTGAGLVTLASPDEAIDIQASHLSAVMLKRCDSNENWAELVDDSRITAVLIGPANGVDESTRSCVETSLRRATPCVLDADALSAFADDPDRLIQALKGSSAPVILTPHTGEFTRVFGQCIDGKLSKRQQAVDAARLCGAVVVYKGSDTVIASPDGRSRINANAAPWLATAGSGDVLAGVASALLAQGTPAFDAASAAVWIHGDAATQHGFPMTSENLLSALQQTMRKLIATTGPSRPIGLPQSKESAQEFLPRTHTH